MAVLPRSSLIAVLLVGLAAAGVAITARHLPQRVGNLGARPKNVVVFVECTFRVDQLAAWGAKVDPTPFFTKKTVHGLRFAKTIAAAPWTRPAMAALFTGEPPTHMGMVDRGTGVDNTTLHSDVLTLGERFQEAGYRTVGGTANPNLYDSFGFSQGFDRWFQPNSLWRDGMTKQDGTVLVDQVLGAIKESKNGQPFYAQVVLIDTHLPYTLGPAAEARWSAPGVSPRVARYRAMLEAFDLNLRRFVEGLKAIGHDESDTMFFVTGDHGEGLKMPFHHGKGHGRYLYPSTVHVPLVAWGAGVRAGATVEGLVSGVDLAPTIAGALGLAPLGTGKDLSAVLRDPGATNRERAFVSTFYRNVERAALYTPTRFCQRDHGSRSDGQTAGEARFKDACFDWVTDPDASIPFSDPSLAAEEQDTFQKSIHAVDVWLAAHPATDVPVSREVQEQLKALGYVGE